MDQASQSIDSAVLDVDTERLNDDWVDRVAWLEPDRRNLRHELFGSSGHVGCRKRISVGVEKLG